MRGRGALLKLMSMFAPHQGWKWIEISYWYWRRELVLHRLKAFTTWGRKLYEVEAEEALVGEGSWADLTTCHFSLLAKTSQVFVFCILCFVFCVLYFVFCVLYFVFCILYFVFLGPRDPSQLTPSTQQLGNSISPPEEAPLLISYSVGKGRLCHPWQD